MLLILSKNSYIDDEKNYDIYVEMRDCIAHIIVPGEELERLHKVKLIPYDCDTTRPMILLRRSRRNTMSFWQSSY